MRLARTSGPQRECALTPGGGSLGLLAAGLNLEASGDGGGAPHGERGEGRAREGALCERHGGSHGGGDGGSCTGGHGCSEVSLWMSRERRNAGRAGVGA